MALPTSDLMAALAVRNNTVPFEGPRVVNVQPDFSASAAAQQIDLGPVGTENGMFAVQSVYIDNTTNSTLTLVVSVTGQVITAPPKSNGVYPVFCLTPIFTVQLSSTSVLPITISFCNFFQPYYSTNNTQGISAPSQSQSLAQLIQGAAKSIGIVNLTAGSPSAVLLGNVASRRNWMRSASFSAVAVAGAFATPYVANLVLMDGASQIFSNIVVFDRAATAAGTAQEVQRINSGEMVYLGNLANVAVTVALNPAPPADATIAVCANIYGGQA